MHRAMLLLHSEQYAPASNNAEISARVMTLTSRIFTSLEHATLRAQDVNQHNKELPHQVGQAGDSSWRLNEAGQVADPAGQMQALSWTCTHTEAG